MILYPYVQQVWTLPGVKDYQWKIASEIQQMGAKPKVVQKKHILGLIAF